MQPHENAPRVVRHGVGWPYRYRCRIESKTTWWRKRTVWRYVVEREWASVWEDDGQGLWLASRDAAVDDGNCLLDHLAEVHTDYITREPRP